MDAILGPVLFLGCIAALAYVTWLKLGRRAMADNEGWTEEDYQDIARDTLALLWDYCDHLARKLDSSFIEAWDGRLAKMRTESLSWVKASSGDDVTDVAGFVSHYRHLLRDTESDKDLIFWLVEVVAQIRNRLKGESAALHEDQPKGEPEVSNYAADVRQGDKGEPAEFEITHIERRIPRYDLPDDQSSGWTSKELLVLNDLIDHAKDFAAECAQEHQTTMAGCWKTTADALTELRDGRGQ